MNTSNTKGEKKILLQFQRFSETDTFKKEVARIRKVCRLPKNGIKPTNDDIENLSNIFRTPDNYPPIKEGEPKFALKTLNLETKKIIDLLPISNLYLSSLVKHYIIFNKFFYDELGTLKDFFHTSNVCELGDAQMEFDEYAPSEDPEEFYGSFTIKGYIEMLENKLWEYPVVLRIHPDASQRDIMEYIKKHWQQIKHYQDKYADRNKQASFKNSKTKENSKIKKRDDFIYKNRNLPRKEIMRMVTDEFGETLDYGHIGKIISLRNKRKKV